MTLLFADPTEWWLEIPPDLQASVWQASVWQHPHGSTPSSRWNAYLNDLCLQVVLPWLRAEYAADATVWSDAPAIWEVVNGTAIVLGTKRLVLLPSEVIDASELAVPQEWVDIPNWAADYYLAVQVKLDRSPEESPERPDQWIRVWGYTTHQDLKTIGSYDPDDRTYCLSPPALSQDLNALGVTLQFCPQAQTQAAVAPLPPLAAGQVNALVQRLGQAIAFPRLAVPFALWGALLEQEQGRQQLYQQRLQSAGLTGGGGQIVQWWQRQITAGWQTLAALSEGATSEGATTGRLAFNFRSAAANSPEAAVTRGKRIELATQPQCAVVLVMTLEPEPDGRVGISVQLHPDGSALLPADLTLALLSEGERLQSVQSTEQDNYMQLRRFRCPAGTAFSLQLQLDEVGVTEDFVV